MKPGESTRIARLDRLHFEYVQTRKELEDKLEEVRVLREKLAILDKKLR